MKAIRFLPHLFVAVGLVLGAVDLVREWKTTRVLELAAKQAVRVTVTAPLHSAACTDRTPCAIESAADAAKQYLVSAGFREALCINPNGPSFSGILVWVFSCDGSPACSTSDRAVCVKIDMTAVTVGPNETVIPSSRVTVQYPHSWTVSSVLGLLPRSSGWLPKSVSTSALMPLPL